MPEQSIISSQIDNILLQRKAKAAEMRRRREQILELKQALMGCRTLSAKAKSIDDPKLQKQCMDMLYQVRVPMEVLTQTDRVLTRMQEVISRFERDSLNIATVGRARQGKSTFLQAVSNLGNDIIPAFDAGDCTGAVSIIHNDPTMEAGQVRVDLTFRTKEEMLDIVKGYINNISPEYLQNKPLEYDHIQDISLPDLEKTMASWDAEAKTQLDHLEKIVNEYNGTSDSKSVSIRDLCGRSGISLSDPNEIRKYVAQYNGKKIVDPLRENYYSYLAVSRAEIYCRFSDDVGKLVLVDTIGLGDTQLGIETSMLETVDKQCDAAIVVTKPITGVTKEDLQLYKLLKDNFLHRDMRKWVFYVANLHRGVNDNAVDSFHQHVTGNNNFAIADCKKLDCSDSESVRRDFLLPMLSSLLGSLEQIDNVHINEVDKMCAKLQGMIRSMLKAFPKPEIAGSTNPGMEVANLGAECYTRLTSNLANQVSYWYEQRNKPNATLWNRVKDILNNLESILPSEEVLQNVLDQSGDLTGFDLWQRPLNYVRNEITDQFIAIDDLMEQEALAFKNALVDELYNSLKTMGSTDDEPDAPAASGDSEEPQEEKPVDQTKWLWSVMEPLIRDNPEYIQIYRAFQFLDQFSFNVRAQIIQEVRYQLGIINPMTVEFYMQPNYVFSKSNAGQSVHFYMTSRLAILEDSLRQSLMQMNKMPNQAFYAAAEEFYDRLTFASDFKNGKFVNMSAIWNKFFAQYSNIIWKKELEKQETVRMVMEEYKEYCNLLSSKLSVLA